MSKRLQGHGLGTFLRLAVLVAVGVGMLASGGPATAQDGVPPTNCPEGFDYPAEKKPVTALYGVHNNLSSFPVRDQAAHMQPTKELRAQVARTTMLWSNVEPTRGHRDWSRVDAAVAHAVAAGVEPMIVFYHSPTWANGAAPGPNAGDQVPTDPAAFDRWVNDYAAFIRAAAERYRGRVRLWEVWNEQNGRFTWQPRPNPGQYARFYPRMRSVLKAVDPGNRVSMGALGNITAGHPDSIYGLDYLRQVNAAGLFPDIVSVHAFPSKGQAPDSHIRFQNNFDDIQTVRDYMESVNWNAPMWVTEWGWSTEENRSGIDAVDPETQARYVYCSLNILAREYRYVTVATYFLDRDRQTFAYGLFNREAAAKPAGRAFQKFMRENNVQPMPGAVSPLDIEEGSGLGGDGSGGDGTGGGITGRLRRAGVHRLVVSPLTFRVPSRRVHVGRGLGTRVHYKLRKNALVHFRVESARQGRIRGGKCEPGRPAREEARCTAWVEVPGHFFKSGKRGKNQFRFSGRLRRRALPPGLHLLVASRADGGPVIGTPFWVERRRNR